MGNTMIEIEFCLPRSIRVKITSRCQYRCKFCHQEGYFNSNDVGTKELLRAVKILREELGLYRLHFTGGEPTLLDEFLRLLKIAKQLGFVNSLTTNGQFQLESLPKFKIAGLDSINFSLHTLNASAFLNLQDIPVTATNLKWAKNCICRTIENAKAANNLIETKINCVVGKDRASAQSILEFCIKNKIKLRFLNDLTLGRMAVETIQEILLERKTKLVRNEITLLSSSHRLDYQVRLYQFGVKCIRKFFLKSLCENCKLKKNNRCLEGFYGIRLEGDPLMVRLCLNRNGTPFVQPFDLFMESKQFKEFKEKRQTISEYLSMEE